MSTTTDKLALFKYDPRTDGAQTFNIQKALNDNWDKLDDAVKEILITLANKAPGGFGWGEAMKDVLASDAKDTYETYCGKLDMLLADMPDGTSQLIYTRGPVSTGQYSEAGNIVAVLSKILGTSASLIGLSPDPRGTPNGLWRMLKDNGNWQPVEWINPPMTLGTEYRTTERYLGKPVYTKTFNIPVSAFENQLPSYSHGIDHLDRLVDARVYCRADWIRILPWSYFDSTALSAQYMLNSSVIRFELGSNALARIKEYTNGVDATLKYTKTTD